MYMDLMDTITDSPESSAAPKKVTEYTGTSWINSLAFSELTLLSNSKLSSRPS